MPRLNRYLTRQGVAELVLRAQRKGKNKNADVAESLGISERAYQNLVSREKKQAAISNQVRSKLLSEFFSFAEYEHFTSDRTQRKTERDEKRNRPQKRQVSGGLPPVTIGDALLPTIAPPLPERVTAQTIDDRLLADYLTGPGLAQWRGEAGQWETTVQRMRHCLTANPEDIYCRAMLTWSVLNRGYPREMVEILKEIREWLFPDRRRSKIRPDSRMLRQKIDKKIAQFENETVEYPYAERMHIEDTLVRAALLRWLRAQKEWEATFSRLCDNLEKHRDMKQLFKITKSLRTDCWFDDAIKHVDLWVTWEPESGLPQLCLLWFTGLRFISHQRGNGRMQESIKQMHKAIQQTCNWLEPRSGHALVRWATIWLAGLCEEEVARPAIELTVQWLEEPAQADECLVRHGFLWSVGVKGSKGQFEQAMSQTERWLKAHPTDDFIRVAYLLFLIRRNQQPDAPVKRRTVIGEVRNWLCKHGDDQYGLTRLAVRLCASAPHA